MDTAICWRGHGGSQLQSAHTVKVDLWGCWQTQGMNKPVTQSARNIRQETSDYAQSTGQDCFLLAVYILLTSGHLEIYDMAEWYCIKQETKQNLEIKSTDNTESTFWTILLTFCTSSLHPFSIWWEIEREGKGERSKKKEEFTNWMIWPYSTEYIENVCISESFSVENS